jgi:hypothetical protein
MQVRRIVAYIDAAADVVGFTSAEFFLRQVMHLRQILDGFPMISGTATTRRRGHEYRAARPAAGRGVR